jgi:hypothetical protein
MQGDHHVANDLDLAKPAFGTYAMNDGCRFGRGPSSYAYARALNLTRRDVSGSAGLLDCLG